MDKKTSDIWASALLSDGEILFWYTGQSPCTVNDFYKDFYYSGIIQSEYEKKHELKCACMCFSFFKEDEFDWTNGFIFNKLAKEFYSNFPISTDSRGSRPPY